MELHELTAAFHEVADEVAGRPEPYNALRHRVRRAKRRRTVWRAASAAAAVAILTIGGYGVVAASGERQLPATPVDGPFLGWPVAGNAAAQGSDLDRAMAAWRRRGTEPGAASQGPYTDVHPLLVHRQSALGLVVFVEAYDASGRPRLAFITASVGNVDALVVRSDLPAPDPVSTKVVSLVSARLGASTCAVSASAAAWLLAVGAPGTDTLTGRSTATDEQDTDGAGPPGRVLVALEPLDATAANTRVTGYRSGSEVYSAPVTTGAAGDSVPVPADVLSATDTQMTLRPRDWAGIAPNQLVVDTTGLVGRVTGVDAAHVVKVEPVTAPGFHLDAHTSLTNIPGTVQGQGTRASFVQVPAGATVSPGNRIVVADPAQCDQAAGAVTAGRVDTKLPQGAGTTVSFAMSMPVKPDGVRTASILVPSQGHNS